MKKEVTNFINSIEGFGNLIVSKPDGTTVKHQFKNTISKHFRQSLINAILYGDEEKVFDDTGNETPNSNPEGYYWSNKLIAYQFKVTVGQDDANAYPSVTSQENVKSGLTSVLSFPSNTLQGESRINVIGNIDTNQAQLIEGFNPQEIRLGKDLDPNTGQWTSFNQQNSFDLEQNVFTGYTSVYANGVAVPGLKQPQFKPARENLRVDSDGTPLKTVNIDKYTNIAKSWWDWEEDSESYGGTQATLRQSMGAGRWVVGAYRTDNEEMIAKYDLANGIDSDRTMWSAGGRIENIGTNYKDVKASTDSGLSVDRQYFADSGYGKELIRGSITQEYTITSEFAGQDISEFYPIDFELYTPEERWYWSFSHNYQNTANWDLANPTKRWHTRDVETHKAGVITAIEVQNFPSKMMFGDDTTISVDPETLAYYVPSHSPSSKIGIDRNDNLTVEYNFKFTTPTGTTLTWNGMYLDELAKAINPVKDTDQVTNSANKIQMTGAVLYESGVFESGTDEKIIGQENFKTQRILPDKIRKKHPNWRQTDNDPTGGYSTESTMPSGNDTIGTEVTRVLTDGNGKETLNPTFARIWCSPIADLFADTSNGQEGSNDFTNDQNNNSQPINYDFQYTTADQSSHWTERRSFYAQTFHSRKPDISTNAFTIGNQFDYFQHMVSVLFDKTDGYMNFDNNRCQIFLSPYGNISQAIVRHAKLTNWLNDYRVSVYLNDAGNVVGYIRYDSSGNSTAYGNTTPGTGVYPVVNIETIWQNGTRMFGDSGLITGDGTEADLTTIHSYADQAVETLSLEASSTKDSFMIPALDTEESISVIKLRTTSDSRFNTSPKFFTVNYGSQNGHPVPGDMHDQKIESQWNLKENWVEELNKISEAGGFTANSTVDWTEYYRVEDRDLIPQLNTNQLEHYLGQNDPTGYGEQGFLVRNSDGQVVFPELELATQKSGMAILHDVGSFNIKTAADEFKSTEPIADYTGDVKRSIIYGGELYDQSDQNSVWNFRDNPMVVAGYTDENSMSVERPYHYWTELQAGIRDITITSTTTVSLSQYTAVDAVATYGEYNPDLDLANGQVGDTFLVANPSTYPDEATHILDVTKNLTVTKQYVTGDKTVTVGTTIVGAFKQESDIGEGEVAGTTVYANGDTFTTAGLVVIDTLFNDMAGNSPDNKWKFGDDYVFLKDETITIVATEPEVRTAEYKLTFGMLDTDLKGYTFTIQAADATSIVNTWNPEGGDYPIPFKKSRITITIGDSESDDYTLAAAISAFGETDVEGTSLGSIPEGSGGTTVASVFPLWTAGTYTWGDIDSAATGEIPITYGKLQVGVSTVVNGNYVLHDNIVGTKLADQDNNLPQNPSWDLGDNFVVEKWKLANYDQFLGQQFTCRGTTEAVTTWSIGASSNVPYPTRAYGENNVVASNDGRFISSGIKTLMENKTGYIKYEGGGIKVFPDIGTITIVTSEADQVNTFTIAQATAKFVWHDWEMETANDNVGNGDTVTISFANGVEEGEYIRTVAESTFTGHDWNSVVTTSPIGTTLTITGSKTESNYEDLLVDLKQTIGVRGLQKVSLDDYIHRTVDFDPEIYENKIFTETGIRYTYIKQGTNPVLNNDGSYTTTDSLLANYADALQKGYRETAPFRVSWNSADNDQATSSSDANPHVATFDLKSTKVENMILPRTFNYGRFKSKTVQETVGGMTFDVVKATNTPFGNYTSMEDATEWKEAWGTASDMENNFPIYKAWADRFRPTVKTVWDDALSDTKIVGDFPIPKSFRLNSQLTAPLATNTTGEYNDGSTNLSYSESLMDQIDLAENLPFPSIEDIIVVVRAREDSDDYFLSDQELMQFVTSIAPHGFKEMYEYDNATPNRMRLSLPSGNNHMFYGVIDIGGGSTGGADIGDQGPTWTPGDQLQLTWTVKPPIRDSVSVSEEND